MFDSITAATRQKADLLGQADQINGQIRILKRDETIDDDTFEDLRFDLVTKVKSLEREVEVIQAWLRENDPEREGTPSFRRLIERHALVRAAEVKAAAVIQNSENNRKAAEVKARAHDRAREDEIERAKGAWP